MWVAMWVVKGSASPGISPTLAQGRPATRLTKLAARLGSLGTPSGVVALASHVSKPLGVTASAAAAVSCAYTTVCEFISCA